MRRFRRRWAPATKGPVSALSEATPAAHRRKAVARAVYGAYGLFVAAFIAYSAQQVVRTLFFDGTAPAYPLPEACASELRGLLGAVDRAAAAVEVAHAPGEQQARDAFRSALSPEWNDLDAARAACRSEPDAEEALAAMLRLERAYEAHAADLAARTAEPRRDLERRIGAPAGSIRGTRLSLP